MVRDNIPLEEIEVGMSASYSQTITDADIKSYAGLSGDHNPIHVNEEYAGSSRFGKRIAHGMISSSFFSALFGTKLPGCGCVYASQTLHFRYPVYIGDTVTATVTVKHIDIDRRRLVFDTVCKVRNRKVITGEAEIYIPDNRK
ncbi:MaoC family dehydratase [Escherichia coli]|nr:MaoC family dehydratase [Escherichia coli]EHH9498430.1 MaoC family dehydratase [Escherichia coli]EHK3727318.1 MaoC family dehydratase [Escherichia coli]EIG9378363.1 MaoC family dehydratase [Escherichia coli]EIH6649808.1 MaoC family dehydratase [Escherichia coli]